MEEEFHWRDIRKKEFYLEKETIFLNGGSLGPTPKRSVDHVNELNTLVACNPGRGQGIVSKLVEKARKKLAMFVGTNPDRIALVLNTTTGMNLPLQTVLKPGDEIVMSDQEYPSVQMMWKGMVNFWNHIIKSYISNPNKDQLITIHKVSLPVPPVNHEDIVNAYRSKMSEKTKAMIFSHVYCTTGLVTDPKILTELAHSYGSISIVDGAHAVGMVPVALDEYECDFYATSCHKWLLAPEGIGMIYIHPDQQNKVAPIIKGYNMKDEESASRYDMTGTRDHTHLAGLGDSIDLQNEIGWENIRSYCLGLAGHLKERIKEIPGARLTLPEDMSAFLTTFTIDNADWGKIGENVSKYNIQVAGSNPMDARSNSTIRVMRVSTHFYNSYKDIDTLVDAIEEVTGRI